MPRRPRGIAGSGADSYSLSIDTPPLRDEAKHRRDTMNQPTATVRIAAFFAAALVTSVLVASQFGLASRYDADAGLMLARDAVQLPLAQAQASAAAARVPA
jgi:hypothetical protein